MGRPIRESGLSFKLDVSVNDDFGSSTAEVLRLALTEHRDFSQRAMMSELAQGDYVEAFLAYRDFKTCNELLEQMVIEATILSHENYCNGRSGGTGHHSPEYVQQRRQDDYQTFLDEFSLTVPVEA